MLKRFGYRPICVQSAREGLRIALEEQPALIVVDLVMRDLDCFEFITCLRATPEAQSIPIVIWTATDVTSEECRRLLKSTRAEVTRGNLSAAALMEQIRRFLARSTRLAASS
jgi:DNA-binding response OmpR family regulator